MYSIKDSSGAEVAICERITHIILQDNGYFAPCPEPDAQGICAGGVVYHLAGRPEFARPDGAEVLTVTLEEFDGALRIAETSAAAADEALSILRGEVTEA